MRGREKLRLILHLSDYLRLHVAPDRDVVHDSLVEAAAEVRHRPSGW